MQGWALPPTLFSDTGFHSQLERGSKHRSHGKFRKGPRVQPLKAGPRRSMLLLGSPPSRAEAGPPSSVSGRAAGPLRGLAQPIKHTYNSQYRGGGAMQDWPTTGDGTTGP